MTGSRPSGAAIRRCVRGESVGWDSSGIASVDSRASHFSPGAGARARLEGLPDPIRPRLQRSRSSGGVTAGGSCSTEAAITILAPQRRLQASTAALDGSLHRREHVSQRFVYQRWPPYPKLRRWPSLRFTCHAGGPLRNHSFVFRRRPTGRRPFVYRSSCRGFVALASLMGVFLIVGCSKKSSKPTAPEAPEVNSDAPNANARIVSQQILGQSGRRSVIWQLESADGLSPFFRGRLDDNVGVGRLGAAGGLMWHVRTLYEPRDLQALSPSSPTPGGAIVVGAFDSNDDGFSETGYATLVTAAGSMLNQVTYASDSSNLWINDIAPLSDSVFVLVGGEHTVSRDNPLVALLALTAAGTLEERQQTVISSILGRFAVEVATDPADASAPVRRIYLATKAYSGTSTITVHGVDITASTLAPWSLAWSQTLTGKGVATWEGDMRVSGGALYVVGGASDPDKGTLSGGGYWSSGLVARLSLGGDIEWTKVVTATGHDDEFSAVEPTANAIIAIGGAAYYYKEKSKNTFGYGWVTRFAPADGGTLSSFLFGDSTFSSAFYCGHLAGSALQVGGYSQLETYGGVYRAWWSALNPNPAASTAAVLRLVPAGPGEAVARDHRRQSPDR